MNDEALHVVDWLMKLNTVVEQIRYRTRDKKRASSIR